MTDLLVDLALSVLHGLFVIAVYRAIFHRAGYRVIRADKVNRLIALAFLRRRRHRDPTD